MGHLSIHKELLGVDSPEDISIIEGVLRGETTKKFIFITGGVTSSLGKGLASASLAALMERRGIRIGMLKMDPYINVDPGTMSPTQHGEVFVTDDGAETDLDLGHYERFTALTLKRSCNFTTGQVYLNVIEREREGKYLGKTVQVVPHITDEIKNRIHIAAEECEFYWQAVRLRYQSQPFLNIHGSCRHRQCSFSPVLLPYIALRRTKTNRPNSVKELRSGLARYLLAHRDFEQLIAENRPL